MGGMPQALGQSPRATRDRARAAHLRYEGRVPDASFSALLRRSLGALERERPDIAQRLAAALAALAVTITVGDEQLGIRSDGTRVVVGEPASAPQVRVSTGRATILALVDGAVSLVDAVLADDMRLVGEVADLARFHDALWLYLQGAVRAPSFPVLLRVFRDAS